jgi:hypothetical protein
VNTGLAASTSYVSPCYGRFARIVATTQGSYTYFLRNYTSLVSQNLAGINGAAVSATTAQLGMNIVQTGGTAVSAVGVTQTGLPLPIGAVDQSNINRRIITTPLGDLVTGNRTIPTSSAALSSTTTGNTPIGSASYNNQVPQTIQDTLQFEGQNHVELLAQILNELKVLNQQFYELPKVLSLALQGPTAPQQGSNVQLGDDPFILRQESSIFINQQ